MNYLIDANVISELVKPTPNGGVIDFMERIAEANIYLCAITLGELHDGIARLPDGKRKRKLHEWLSNDLMHRFQGRILSFSAEEAETWGRHRGSAGAHAPLMWDAYSGRATPEPPISWGISFNFGLPS